MPISKQKTRVSTTGVQEDSYESEVLNYTLELLNGRADSTEDVGISLRDGAIDVEGYTVRKKWLKDLSDERDLDEIDALKILNGLEQPRYAKNAERVLDKDVNYDIEDFSDYILNRGGSSREIEEYLESSNSVAN